MDNKIITYLTLLNLVDLDKKDHKLKDIATLFLNAMNDWKTLNQINIADFISELETYYGKPLTKEKIEDKRFDGKNAWQTEAASSIVDLIKISSEFYNQSDFQKIIENILNYYNEEFRKVDFIAELKYLTAKEGGRSVEAKSGYRPQVKFAFAEMQTSGQQTFIDKETVYPGENVTAKIKMGSTYYFHESLTEGMKFEFREGALIIGTGEIKYIVNDRLQKASR